MTDKTKAVQVPSNGEIEDIKKIRDILFGNNMNEYDKRFEMLEQRMSKSIEEAKEENEKRLVLLEDYVKQEFKSLQEKLIVEKEIRSKGEKRTHEDIKSIEESAQNFVDKTSNDFSEIRKQILDLGKSIGERINAQERTLDGQIKSVDENLQANKVDRASLAMMLTEVAMKLSGQQEEE